MQKCVDCQVFIPASVVIAGRRIDLRGRQRCLECLPHRELRGPRKPVIRPVQVKLCAQCGREFAARVVIDGKVRMLYRRLFCFECSPFGARNTSRRPPGDLDPDALALHRRRRRSETTYKSQKKRRRKAKAELVVAFGGQCTDCGYSASVVALEFHHRDATTKSFSIGAASVSRARLWAEAAKCDLVCANCHRTRHAGSRGPSGAPVVQFRRRTKLRAVDSLGGRCRGCDGAFPVVAFEFHHLEAGAKEFAISSDGIPRPWEKVAAELEKCVLLCANCHREVHAGVRELFDDGLLGLAEEATPYAA
jgi:hypothetical protein